MSFYDVPMKSQRHFFDASFKDIAETNELFMEEFVNGPNPLTPEEIDAMCDRRPQWERFRGFGARAKAAREQINGGIQ